MSGRDRGLGMEMLLERPAGVTETLLIESHIELAGCTQATVAAELDEPLPTPVIIDRLRTLFGRQPMLRARLGGASPDWRFVCDAVFEDVDILSVAFERVGTLEAVFTEECDKVLDIGAGPLWRVLLVVNGTDDRQVATAVLVTFAHAIADGRSLMAFMQDLLGGPDPTPSENGQSHLCPPLETILIRRRIPVEEPAADAVEPAGEWPFDKNVDIEDRRTSMVQGYLDAEVSAELMRRWVAEGTTADAFFVSAMLAALGRHAPMALSCPVICAFDARPYLNPPVPAGEIGVYIKHVELFDRSWAADRLGIWDRAGRVARQLSEEWRSALGQAETRSTAEVRDLIALGAKHPMTGFATSFSISNLISRTRDVDATVNCRSIHFCSTDRIGVTGLQVVVTELDGRLAFAFIYADPLIRREVVESVRDDFIDGLRSAAR